MTAEEKAFARYVSSKIRQANINNNKFGLTAAEKNRFNKLYEKYGSEKNSGSSNKGMNSVGRPQRNKRKRPNVGVSNEQLIQAGVIAAPSKKAPPRKARKISNNASPAPVNQNANNNSKEGINISKIAGKANLFYANVVKNIKPYIQSRIWARRINKRARGLPVTNADSIPTKEMVYTALVTSLGMRYITTGRGGAAEDAPFLPKVAAIPVIPRSLWSTKSTSMRVDMVNRDMTNLWGALGKNTRNTIIVPTTPGVAEPALTRGAISNFYKPAFRQICTHDGEWLVNGFKVDKPRVQRVAAGVLQQMGLSPAQANQDSKSNIGPASKGTTAAESDMLKITILNYNDPIKSTIIFTIGEVKVGEGEAAGSKGKEMAQLRFTMYAIYYMFRQVHLDGNHPWASIKNLKIEAVFLAAGAENINNVKFTVQQVPTSVRLSASNTATMSVSKVNLDKFCAIFRLDKRRFGLAMTEVDRIFLNSMVGYMTAIRNNPNEPILLNTRLPAIEKLGARLSATLTPQNFKLAKLYTSRKSWGNNRNRSNYEARWLEKFAQRFARIGGTNVNIKTATNGLRGIQMPTTSQNTGGQSRAVGTGQGQISETMNNASSSFNKNAYLQSIAKSSNSNFGAVYGQFMRDHSNLKANLVAKLTNMRAKNKLAYIGLQNRAAVGGRRGR
jgi:hypothetical protein